MKYQIKLTLIALVIGLFLTFNQITKAQSALDGFDPNANNLVRAVVVQPDGKILIGGDFTSVLGTARNRIARLNTDGTLDAAFNPNANNSVISIAVQPDGKVLAGGFFTTIGGQTRKYIARLDAATGAPDSFNPNASSFVLSIAVQSDGKVLAGGDFTSIGGQTRSRIARLDQTTGAADSFDPNANNLVFSIAVQSDGKVLAGGNFSTIGGQTRSRIARLDPTTGAADSFNPNANDIVYSIAVQSDGKVLAGGIFTTIGGQTRNRIARLDPTTGTADSFDPNASGSVLSIAVQSDGKVLAGGEFTIIGGQARNRIARLDATTGAADSFDPNASGIVLSIAVQSDGKVLAGGEFTTIGGQTRNNIARLERDGRLDQTLNLSAVGNEVRATAIQPDGKIIIGGSFSSILGTARNNIARLNTDGTLDTGFNPNAGSDVSAIAVQTDGKIVIGGIFTTLAPNGGAVMTRNHIARLNTDGTLDMTFNPNADNSIISITVQSDGKILAGGFFTSFMPNGGAAVTRNHIVRLKTDGTVDAFDPNANANVQTIAVQTNDKVLIGGNFTTLAPNGGATLTRNRIARLNMDGTLDNSFDPNANNVVDVITILSNGRILIGGFFNSLAPNGGASFIRNGIARLNADGTLDAFNPNVDNIVYAIAAQTDGRIIIGGVFTNVGGTTRNHLARVNEDGTLDPNFNPNADNNVYAVNLQSDGKILATGLFANIGGTARSRFARLTNDTAAFSSLYILKTSITLTRDGSAPQFNRVIFEQSTDNGATYTTLGTATNNFAASPLPADGSTIAESGSVKSGGAKLFAAPLAGKTPQIVAAPVASGYTLTGLNLPTGQNILIRARGFYQSGFQSGSETIEDKVQNAFLLGTTAVGVSIAGRLKTADGRGLMGATVTLTTADGRTVTARSTAFGAFHFDGLAAGQAVIVTVQAKRYVFAPQLISLTDNLSNLELIAVN